MTTPTADRVLRLREVGPARRGSRPDEVVIAVSPAFAGIFTKTIVEVPHAEVLRQLLAGIEEQGVTARVIQVHDTADLAAISHLGARLSGSGISVGAGRPARTHASERIARRVAPQATGWVSRTRAGRSPVIRCASARTIASDAAIRLPTGYTRSPSSTSDSSM